MKVSLYFINFSHSWHFRHTKLLLMVKHIVFFKLIPQAPSENKELGLNKMQEIFSHLGEQLPYIAEFRTGINFNESDSAWDFIIDSLFNNREDLTRYQESQEHQEAIKRGREILKTKAVIDYEF